MFKFHSLEVVLNLLVAGLAMQYVSAETVLYVPGFEEQPLSLSELGVGADGRTTYEILPGAPTGTFTAAAFSGSAILVEGPSNAYISYSASGYENSFSCSIGPNGISNCGEVHAYANSMMFWGSGSYDQTTLTPFEVQDGRTASAPGLASTPGASDDSLSTKIPPSGSSTSTGLGPGRSSGDNSGTITSKSGLLVAFIASLVGLTAASF